MPQGQWTDPRYEDVVKAYDQLRSGRASSSCTNCPGGTGFILFCPRPGDPPVALPCPHHEGA
jgi:hypothetical protein